MTQTLLIYWTTFFFLLGACIGSFLNVLIGRLPHRGEMVTCLGKTAKLTLSWPPSHCPHCDTPIHWYHNIPILAWIFLRGRCANCRAPIAIRYPLVELATALLFSGLFIAYFIGGFPATPIPGPRPFQNIATDWPVFALHLMLIASLLAATAIDADWFIIPLSIPAFITIVALLAAPFTFSPVLPSLDVDPKSAFSIATLGLPTLAAAVGLLLANLLVYLKVLPLSFAEPVKTPSSDAPMANGKSKMANPAPPDPSTTENPVAPPPNFSRPIPLILATTLLLAAIASAWLLTPPPHTYAVLAIIIAAIIIFLLGVLPRDPAPAGSADMAQEVMDEISTPHSRREILKEILFLSIPIVFALSAFAIPSPLPNAPWLARLLGTMFGFLIGGGIIWFIRIGGTLLFGKEAMGLGDVHLMAGVGAVIGPALALVTVIPFACVLGLAFALILLALRKPNVLPFGPWLSVGAILSMLVGNSLIHWYLSTLAH